MQLTSTKFVVSWTSTTTQYPIKVNLFTESLLSLPHKNITNRGTNRWRGLAWDYHGICLQTRTLSLDIPDAIVVWTAKTAWMGCFLNVLTPRHAANGKNSCSLKSLIRSQERSRSVKCLNKTPLVTTSCLVLGFICVPRSHLEFLFCRSKTRIAVLNHSHLPL